MSPPLLLLFLVFFRPIYISFIFLSFRYSYSPPHISFYVTSDSISVPFSLLSHLCSFYLSYPFYSMFCISSWSLITFPLSQFSLPLLYSPHISFSVQCLVPFLQFFLFFLLAACLLLHTSCSLIPLGFLPSFHSLSFRYPCSPLHTFPFPYSILFHFYSSSLLFISFYLSFSLSLCFLSAFHYIFPLSQFLLLVLCSPHIFSSV